MILAGDELSRTPEGNNNAYCQDNELTWLHWDLDAEGESFLAFVRALLALRAAEPVFRRRTFFQGRPIRGAVKDITWLDASGGEMSDADWAQGWAFCLGVLLAGDAIDETDAHGEPVSGDSFLVALNAAANGVDFHLPASLAGRALTVELDTGAGAAGAAGGPGGAGGVTVADPYPLAAHSAVVIRVGSP